MTTSEQFNCLLAEHDKIHHSARSALRLPVPVGQLASTLAVESTLVPAALTDLYGIADGSELSTAPVFLDAIDFLPSGVAALRRRELIKLDDSGWKQRYQQKSIDCATAVCGDLFWHEDWIPFAEGIGSLIAVDCRPLSPQRLSVILWSSQFPPSARWDSIEAFLTEQIDQFEAGNVRRGRRGVYRS